MSCLPSRAYALRTATLSGVALRLFCLDLAVKYDKVAVSDADAGRKRGGGGRCWKDIALDIHTDEDSKWAASKYEEVVRR
jgi:hypothetical protein